LKTKKEDSLNKRYFFKLSTSLIGIPIQLVIATIIPRSLGPVTYGQFSFLTNSFSQIFGFFNSGTSIAYYTKLSGDLESKEIITFYLRFILIIFSAIILGTSAIILLKFGNYVWPDQQIKYIYMALFWATLMFISGIVNKTVDAFGVTVKGEIIRGSQKLLALILVLSFFIFWKITLTYYFIYHYLIISFLMFGWLIILRNNGVNLFKLPPLTKTNVSGLTKYFWGYSSHLLVYALIGMIVGILDLWILQYFSGSVQQGFYSLAYKIAAISFIFSKSLTPLITREFTIAFKNNEIVKMSLLFKKYIPLLYAIVAFLAIFLSTQATEVAVIFGGKRFEGAALPIALMVLYPIHQTYGQLSASVFYASGKTKLYRNIGSSIMILGLFLSFFLIAPNTYFGLNLGALGLVIKMLVAQFIVVNIQLFFNTKFLSLCFKKYLSHQVLVIGIFFILAYSIKIFITFLTENNVVSFLSCGLIYLILGVLLIYKFPVLIFTSKTDVHKLKLLLIKKINRQ